MVRNMKSVKGKIDAQASLTPPLKWWGGKTYVAKFAIDLMPPHLNYVEAFGGGLAVLLKKNPMDPRHQWGDVSYEQGKSEIVNDIHGALQNFWNVLKNANALDQLRRILVATPFSESEFDSAADHEPKAELDVSAAAKFFVRCRQSRSGSFKDFATLTRNRTRRMQNEQASAWWNAIEGLPEVHARLKNVVILSRDDIDVIRQQDGEKTLFYLDPPYVHTTRASTDVYAHEMTTADHQKLLDTIRKCQGKVMLSGYTNPLYHNALCDWNRHDMEIDNKASGGATKRKMTESIWCNF